MENVDVEGAHRAKGKGNREAPIIVRFTKFKNKSAVLEKAENEFKGGSVFSVREDYTEQVLAKRKALGRCLKEARYKGQYATCYWQQLS